VYCRVARGEFVFDDANEATEFVEVLREVRDLDGWTILAWCLMGNHYHLVVKTRNVDLWRSMARLQGTVSRRYNRRHGYLGRLWQSRYRARVITTDQYFRQVVAYVHLNPVAAGIVEDPARYSFSGHRELLGLCRPYVVDRVEVYAVFGAAGDEAAADYVSWVRSVAEARFADTEVEELPWWESARHVDEVAGPELRPEVRTFDGLALAEERRELTFDGFLRRFLKISGHDLKALSSRCRGSRLVEGRIELITLGLSRYGLRARDFAALLNKHGATVTRWLNEGLRRERDGLRFQQRLDDLDRAISDHRHNATMRNVAP
jgi:REP element-mobilizing transposase RayT